MHTAGRLVMSTSKYARTRRALLPGALLAAMTLSLTLMAGCATVPDAAKPQSVSQGDLDWTLAGADKIPAADYPPMEELYSLMHVTDEMHRFAVEAVRGNTSIVGRIRALNAALSNEKGLDLKYDAEATLSAEEAFRQRRVNCLSYSLLFVALAREVDIPAQFNEVDIPPVWDISDDQTLVLYRHVNVKIRTTPPFYEVIDVSGDEYDPSFDQRIVPDINVLAQFYNNRSVELRFQHRYVEALRYQLEAIKLTPQADFLWANLAGLYALMDSTKAARVAIYQALQLDPSSMMDYNIAALVYDKSGQPQLAAEYRNRARYFLSQSPYYHYQLALVALGKQQNNDAYDEIRAAILLDPHEHRFYFLAAVILSQLGRVQLADDYMHEAVELAPTTAQALRYQSKFARLSHHT
jgi:tetratricopeptide (TPR) repeat protein